MGKKSGVGIEIGQNEINEMLQYVFKGKKLQEVVTSWRWQLTMKWEKWVTNVCLRSREKQQKQLNQGNNRSHLSNV